MQHRVLVLGNTGMLGHMVEHVLAADERLVVQGVGRTQVDVFRVIARSPRSLARLGTGSAISADDALHALLRRVDFVINCIGITARHMDDADAGSVARAIRVNAEFPHALAAAAQTHGVRVIHMSTDGVFSGRATIPYTEDATPDAMNTYGRVKTLGESRASNVLNIRASIIGPSPYKHEGLWEWVASQPRGATVDGYTNHLWHGVTTVQFAEFCRRVIAEDRFDALRAGGPVLHLAPNHPISKHDLLCAIGDALGKQMAIRPIAHGQPVHRVLAMRADVAAMFGEPQPITAALRACVIART